jgi:GTP-binding protein EngB required for normal cell division
MDAEKVSAKEQRCKWCTYRKAPCEFVEAMDCDFKTLAWDKTAILQRMYEETVKVQALQKKIDKLDHREMFEMLDILVGMGIMTKVLKEEWHMTDEEIEVQAKLPKLSWMQKAKLMAKVKMMEKQRRDT